MIQSLQRRRVYKSLGQLQLGDWRLKKLKVRVTSMKKYSNFHQ